MSPDPLENVTTLTFDIFGTVLDLTGSLVPPIRRFLSTKQTPVDAAEFWAQWRAAVGQLHFEPTETLIEGDHVLVTAQRSGVGEHSGLAVSDTVIQVFSFEGDTCVRVREFYDKAEALRSIGVDRVAD